MRDGIEIEGMQLDTEARRKECDEIKKAFAPFFLSDSDVLGPLPNFIENVLVMS